MKTKMNRNSALYLSLAVLAALAMVFATVQSAAAQETEVELTGTVTSIDEAAGSFTVETGEGETVTIFPGEDFDFSTLQVGDTVTVTGTSNEDGSVAALEINVEEAEDDETGEQNGPSNGYYCTQSETPHPFGARLAERYSMDYETLQA